MPLTMIAAVLHFMIPAGPFGASMDRWMAISGYQILWPYDDFIGLESERVDCECAPGEALKKMLGHVASFDVHDESMSVTVTLRICRPELGALAPLPPCEPQGLSFMRVTVEAMAARGTE